MMAKIHAFLVLLLTLLTSHLAPISSASSDLEDLKEISEELYGNEGPPMSSNLVFERLKWFMQLYEKFKGLIVEKSFHKIASEISRLFAISKIKCNDDHFKLINSLKEYHQSESMHIIPYLDDNLLQQRDGCTMNYQSDLMNIVGSFIQEERANGELLWHHIKMKNSPENSIKGSHYFLDSNFGEALNDYIVDKVGPLKPDTSKSEYSGIFGETIGKVCQLIQVQVSPLTNKYRAISSDFDASMMEANNFVKLWTDLSDICAYIVRNLDQSIDISFQKLANIPEKATLQKVESRFKKKKSFMSLFKRKSKRDD